jgi:alcohol dehydrogenase, propanol-preferring
VVRAWQVVRPGPIDAGGFTFVEVAEPQPAPDEVVVRVEACAVCRTDLHVVLGELPPRRERVIPGHQAVGRVVARGAALKPSDRPELGARVGVAWLHRTCGRCRFCVGGRENLCPDAAFTGWSVDGGFAELLRAPAAFVHPLDPSADAVATAPLLCAGIIGWRALRATGLLDEARRVGGAEPFRLGILGFGAAGHLALQIARARGAEVYVLTRDRERHQALARELGAAWVGDAQAAPPKKLDAAILFAPAGDLVPPALEALEPGGRLILGGIHMSPLPPLDYRLLYGERRIESVANNTRRDGVDFLAAAREAHVRTHVEVVPLARADEALRRLDRDGVRGAAVLVP